MNASPDILDEDEAVPLLARELAPHQLKMVNKALERKGIAAFLAEPRTGKTFAALAYLQMAGYKRILVVCPSIAAGVWRSEARLTNFSLPVYIALEGDLSKRSAALRDWIALHPESLIITNYQSYWREKIAPILLDWKPDAVVMDEISALRGRTTRQSKFAYKLGGLPSVHCRLGLTGTPITNSVQDLFGIYRFIDPKVFGIRWSTFANEFLEFGWFNQVTGSRNDEEIKRRIEATSVQIARSDAWGGLPKRMDQVWPVVLSEESSKRYRKFAKDAVAIIEGTDVEGKHHRGTVTADLVITQVMRLHQMTSGHTRFDNKIIDISSEKVDTAVDLADQAISNNEQVVVFAAFSREIARIAERLADLHPGRVTVIQGGDDPEERTRRISRFRSGELRCLIIQSRVGSMAIDLATASLAIVVSTGYSLEDFIQMRERLTGTDPNRSFSYLYLQAETLDGKKTIDGKIYEILCQKQRVAGRFLTLDYVKNLLLGE